MNERAKENEAARKRAKKGRFGGMEEEEKPIEESEVTETNRTMASKTLNFTELGYKERKGIKESGS